MGSEGGPAIGFRWRRCSSAEWRGLYGAHHTIGIGARYGPGAVSRLQAYSLSGAVPAGTYGTRAVGSVLSVPVAMRCIGD